jgi:hypothetical protein
VWLAVVTTARGLLSLAGMRKRLFICGIVLALLALAALGVVLRSGD